MNKSAEFTIGVEEEYQIINPQTRELCGKAEQIIDHAQKNLAPDLNQDIIQPEMHRSQVEIATTICHSLSEVRQELARCRQMTIDAANKSGQAIAAAGTHPFSDWREQEITPKTRYQNLEAEFQQLIRELVIFGNHVHIGFGDRSLGIQVINRARIWLPVLLALSANSPFWLGQDTGYASYRTEMWTRLPMTGQPQIFEDYQEYQTLIDNLIATGAIKDPTTIYWDIRLSDRFPTIEFRVTDICMTVEEAVTITGLIRALVWTCYQEVINDLPLNRVRPELLRAAHWCAARYGLTGNLIDVVDHASLPAQDLVTSFLNYLHPALAKFGDWEVVSDGVQKILEQGNGAQRQLTIYQKNRSFQDVVDYIVAQTKLEP
ncbi:carboxylate-amine ligase [Pleurocapsales cyanobacterium LEGE 10410]|nr:carboxylate-amine ligase [Pleurocapsales cyanobacterium LEGE 10410]